jgi:predicted Zn-ribbon and HTH transcriptional regulator
MQKLATQPRQTLAAAPARCRRCGQARLDSQAAVCIGCRAQESVARHIPSARRPFTGH